MLNCALALKASTRSDTHLLCSRFTGQTKSCGHSLLRREWGNINCSKYCGKMWAYPSVIRHVSAKHIADSRTRS